MFCCGLLYHLDRPNEKFRLSELTDNESLVGRWYTEYQDDASFAGRETANWAVWDHRRSFWLKKEYLLQAIHDAGFDLVLEQFDGLGSHIADSMTTGSDATDDRSTFVGIKAS